MDNFEENNVTKLRWIINEWRIGWHQGWRDRHQRHRDRHATLLARLLAEEDT